jgi:hypothetical protein
VSAVTAAAEKTSQHIDELAFSKLFVVLKLAFDSPVVGHKHVMLSLDVRQGRLSSSFETREREKNALSKNCIPVLPHERS